MRWRSTPSSSSGETSGNVTETSTSTSTQQLDPSDSSTSTSATSSTSASASTLPSSAISATAAIVSDNDTHEDASHSHHYAEDGNDNNSSDSNSNNNETPTNTLSSSASASASISSTVRRPLDVDDSTTLSSSASKQQARIDYDDGDGGGSSTSASTTISISTAASSAAAVSSLSATQQHNHHHHHRQQQQQQQPFDDQEGDNIVSSSSATGNSSSSSRSELNHIRRRTNPLGSASGPSGPSSSLAAGSTPSSTTPLIFKPVNSHHLNNNHHSNNSQSQGGQSQSHSHSHTYGNNHKKLNHNGNHSQSHNHNRKHNHTHLHHDIHNNHHSNNEDDDDASDASSSPSEDSDDPGTDHAIPDDPPSIPNHETIWKPQTTTSTCEFTHTITNYSQKRESGCKKAEYSSTTIDNFGNRWRLIVYVNGNGRASNHHLSLFLQVADADDLPFGWKKGVSYVLTLEHPSGPTLGYAKRNPDKTFKLCPKAIDWGWSQFITSDRVQQEGYINDDSLIVRASVTVKSSSISIDPDDAELYLKCAVEEGNADAVEACLAQGASVNCKFKDDLYTPLHTACSSSTNDGSLDVLKLLLKRGANGNACNKWKETPLLIAANNGHRAAVEALLENGADPSMCSEAGWSALTFAAHKGYDDIVALLLAAGAPVNCRVIEDFSTPLHKACAGGKTGHLSAVKQLIAGDADVHSLNKWRETPLLTAANHGQAAAVEALLDAGGDPCKCTDTGWSPLSIAAYKGHDDVVRLLLEQGAPTEEADPTLSALLQAATKGLPDTVELLLRHGADHTVTTKKGDTALSILVEQDLIDAAVEMVTEYKASVPRCSRDRKKVQRARLLIQLRIKQQQREGLLNDTDTDEGSDHDDSDEEFNSALHDSDASPKASSSVSSKKKKKKGKSRETLEAKAEKALQAEKALLLELDQEEEAKAQKDEAAANSKRNKKKKKKERERQVKQEEERQRIEKERKVAEERERKKLLREEKERKERESRAKEKREKDLRDAAERDRIAAKRKEKEERDRRKREQAKKEQMKKDQERKERQRKEAEIAAKSEKKKALLKATSNNMDLSQHSSPSKLQSSSRLKFQQAPLPPSKTTESSKPTTSGKRGWEIKSNTTNTKQQVLDSSLPIQQYNSPSKYVNSESTKLSGNSQPPKSSVEDQLENMANSVVGFVGFDSTPNTSSDGAPGSLTTDVSSVSADQVTMNDASGSMTIESSLNQSTGKSFAIETACLSIVRQEKVNELLRRAGSGSSTQPHHPLASVDAHTVRMIIYKWIVRASYDSTPYLDPVIPSWTDSEMLVAFFQRQIISESSRAGNVISGQIEVMKEAGSFLAELCFSLAKEVVDFSKEYGESLPRGASDSTLNMIASNNNTVISIDWNGHSKVYLPALSFTSLRNRYRGPSHLMLTSIFSAVKRYETLGMIVKGTAADCHLSLPTLNELASEMQVSIELFSNPRSVLRNNTFSGSFADIDTLFNGSKPFSESGNDAELLLTNQGGSAVVLPPLESNTASVYMKRITNILEVTEGKGLPVSVVAFLPMLCFRELKTAPGIENLNLLEPRLLTTHQGFIRHIELLPPGQHAFHTEGGQAAISHTGSMVIFLQNNAGAKYFPLTKDAVTRVIHSLSVPMMTDIGSTSPTSFRVHEAIPASPKRINPSTMSPATANHNMVNGDYTNAINDGSSSVSKSFPTEAKGPSRRRGRIVDLVDDGGEVDDYSEVPGVPKGLNMSELFNPSPNVDIEAISLGLYPSNNFGDDAKSLHQQGRFS